jgi:hypothetical protein
MMLRDIEAGEEGKCGQDGLLWAAEVGWDRHPEVSRDELDEG